MNSPTDLITERLRLRRTRAGDAPVLFRNYTGDPECSRYLQRLPHKDANQTQAMLDTWCEKRWDEPGAPFAWVIALRESDEPVGLFLAIPQDHATQIHYGIARRCWGQSLVAEAGRAVLDALRRNLQTRRVWTLCDVENTGSRRVLEKLGFCQEGILRSELTLPAFGGAARDCYVFSMNEAALSPAAVGR
jgi:ribosomal-protein-alanine N-acetyltransferase